MKFQAGKILFQTNKKQLIVYLVSQKMFLNCELSISIFKKTKSSRVRFFRFEKLVSIKLLSDDLLIVLPLR